MRDLTKSMLSFSWALPLFGAQQMFNLAMPQDPAQPTHRAARAFKAVTRAAEGQLGEVAGVMFRSGDQIQRGVIDAMFGMLGMNSLDPSSMLRGVSDALGRTADGLRQGQSETAKEADEWERRS